MLATAIQDMRTSRGWSVAMLADRAALTAQHIRRLEDGVGSMATVQSVFAALDLTLSHMPPAPSIAEQLVQQRARTGRAVSEVARAAGLSRMTVRALERGQGSVASLDSLVVALAPNSRPKGPPRASWDRAASRRGDDQFTPRDFLDRIVSVFGLIDLDPAWHPNCAVEADRTYSLVAGRNGLNEGWIADLVWLNPPYSELLRWLRKADEEWSSGRARTIVCLVPTRTDSPFFHDRLIQIADIYLLRRRLRFIQLDGQPGNQAPFSLMLAMFGTTEQQRAMLQDQIPGLWVQRP